MDGVQGQAQQRVLFVAVATAPLSDEFGVQGLGREAGRSAEQRAVLVPGEFAGTNHHLAMLALAFSRGETANPTVPYQLWNGEQ